MNDRFDLLSVEGLVGEDEVGAWLGVGVGIGCIRFHLIILIVLFEKVYNHNFTLHLIGQKMLTF